MMHPVVVFDIVYFIAYLVGLAILLRGWKKRFKHGTKFLLIGFIVFNLLYSLCLFLEWSGITKSLDKLEDFIGILLPMWWAFVFYAIMNEAAQQDLIENERRLEAANQQLRVSEQQFEAANQQLMASEKGLQESEQKFRSIAEHSIVGFIIIQDFMFKYVNQAASEILKYSDEEMLSWEPGEGFLNIVHPDDRLLVMEQERRKKEGRNNVFDHYAWKALTKTGKTKYLNTYWSRIPFQGKPADLMTMVDITEHDRAQRRVKISEQQYRELVNSIDGIVWEADARSLRFSFVSKKAEHILGFPSSRWIVEPTFWQDHIHEKDRDWAVEYCKKATAEKRDHTFEYRMITADNRTIWLRDIVHVVVKNGEAVKLRGVMIDVTERKLVEEQIEKIFNMTGYMVCVASMEGYFLKINASFEQTLGYSSEELLGSPFFDFIHPDDVEKTKTVVENKLAEGTKVIGFENRYRCKDGTYKWLSWTSHPVVEEGITYAIAYDVTKRKLAQEELIRYREHLEELVAKRTTKLKETNEQLEHEIKDRIKLEKEILSISEGERKRIGQELHESLGQQLTGVGLMLKGLQQRLSDEERDETVELEKIGKLVSEVIEQMRGLAKGICPIDLSLDGLASGLEQLATNAKNVFGVNCTVKCEGSIPVREVEVATHLYRVAQEAITNAVKHAKAKNIQMELSRGVDSSTLTITNDGLAFPKEFKARGTGTGLQIMDYRIDIIGGSLKIQSGENGSTTIVCEFPNKQPL